MRRITTLLFSMILAVSLHAGKHIFEAGMRGGASGLTYRTDYGKMVPGYDIGLDVGYIYISPYYIGVRAGIGLDYAQSHFVAAPYHDTYDCLDKESDQMVVDYTIQRWDEAHNQLYFSGTVQAALEVKGWRMMVGPKLMAPLSMRYSARAEHTTLTCTYPAYENTVDKSMALSAGDRALQTVNGKIPYPPKMWCALAVETGYAFTLMGSQSLYLAAYANVSLNQNKVVPGYNLSAIYLTDTEQAIPVARMLATALDANNHIEGLQVIRQYGYWDVGIKLAWQIHWGNTRRMRYNRACHCLQYE